MMASHRKNKLKIESYFMQTTTLKWIKDICDQQNVKKITFHFNENENISITRGQK